MPLYPFEERDALLREGEELWRELRAALDARPDEPLYGEGGEMWWSRDVYSHFSRWQWRQIGALRARLDGTEPPPPLDEHEDVINRRWLMEDRVLTLDEARERCLRSTALLRSIALGMTVEQWERYGAYVDDITPDHYRAHLRYIAEAGGP